jgi:hypothetical protein
MDDPWLKKEVAWLMQSPQVQGASNLFVNQHMSLNGKTWDSKKIHSLFPSNVANSILNVPLFDDV